ncbi:hypothetical protein [Paracoccus saliphilus]|uniref:Sulfotransferase family protein n=1 Tax=Paracoccus saliphilus TaxID=405559 RepID=A0AA45W8R4_9RHOB|nr:hypothetical protein [Paracoccus saliphilus]WCR05497.1 hypothetical protein JHX88_21795 [Paracoccus saliphilus]SIT18293.1 hypothetical protein SAMN05421772_13510 [Paracoccus saliphilus]
MKKLFLHIGFNKTGSTSLQKNLAANTHVLARQGIFYPHDPQAPYTQRWQHVPLAAAVPGRNLPWLVPKKRATLAQAYDSLYTQLHHSNFNTLVLSSEGFGERAMGTDKIQWLKDQFPDFEITVIAYIRRQDSYFLSTYQESVKAGRSRPFNFSDHGKVKELYFGQRLAPWRTIFGEQNVLVRPFDPKFWPEGELFFDFLQAIGAARDGTALQAPENEGLDYRAVEFMRQINQFVTEAGRDAGNLRQRVRANKLTATFSQLLETKGKVQKMSLSTEQAEILRRHFRNDNIDALQGSGIDPDEFFPTIASDRAAMLAPQNLEPRDLMLVISRMQLS